MADCTCGKKFHTLGFMEMECGGSMDGDGTGVENVWIECKQNQTTVANNPSDMYPLTLVHINGDSSMLKDNCIEIPTDGWYIVSMSEGATNTASAKLAGIKINGEFAGFNWVTSAGVPFPSVCISRSLKEGDKISFIINIVGTAGTLVSPFCITVKKI